MRLYKGNLVTEATKEQVPLMENHGWSRTAPEADTVKEDLKADPEADTVKEDLKADPDESDEIPGEDGESTDDEDTSSSTSQRLIPRRKPIKRIG